MSPHTIRQWFAPALLAAAIAPLSLSVLAAPGDGHGKQEGWSETHQQRYSEHRQALLERAGIDEETRQALDDVRQAHRAAIKELREEHREQMSELLNDDQRQALSDARQEMRQERRDERRQAIQQRMEEQFEAWELSEEKQQALSDIRESFYADMQDLKTSEFNSRHERREAWQNLRQEYHDAIAEILSEAQIQELRSTIYQGMHNRMSSGGYNHHGRGMHGGYRGE